CYYTVLYLPPSCLEVILWLMLSRTTEETTHGNINRKKQTKQEQSISRNETSRKRNITKQLRKVVRLIAKRCVNTVVRLGQDRINMKENAMYISVITTLSMIHTVMVMCI